MKENNAKPDLLINRGDNEEKTTLKGYPKYPVKEDIYNKFHEEADLDPEEISVYMDSIEVNETGRRDQKTKLSDVQSGRFLDVPGSELDDQQEDIGNEDEENNYYSIGGDGHNELDENRGD